MDKERALSYFDPLQNNDDINRFIEKLYKRGFIITKPEAPLKIHIEALDVNVFNREFILEKIVPEIIEALKASRFKKELKESLDIDG